MISNVSVLMLSVHFRELRNGGWLNVYALE